MIASQAVIERRTGFSESGVVFVVEKHDIDGPHNGRVEIEQHGDRFLDPPLLYAFLLVHEGYVACGEWTQQSSLPSKRKVGTARTSRPPFQFFLESTVVLAQQVVLYGNRALERRLAMGS
jgi:hypothetical protein